MADVIQYVAEFIKEMKRVPAGHLYAALMGVMSYEDFQAVIGNLTRAGLIRYEKSHLLVWQGKPEVAQGKEEVAL